MYKEDLALNNLQWLIGYQTQPNQIIYIWYTVYHKSEYTLTFLQIFKYISSWDNTDKMTLWYNEK